MRLVFAGTPVTAVPSLHALLDSAHEIIAVLTRPDAPSGRGAKVSAAPVARTAREAGVPLLQPASVRTAEFEAELRDLGADAVAVVAFGALIPRRLLDIPPRGWINLHFSLLPSWRGAAPVPAAIRSGDEITGVSTFLIEQGLDTGPVYGSVTDAVRPRDTAGQLLDRLAQSGARLLVATMDGIADGSLTPRPQPADGVSHAGKLAPAHAQVDWSAPAVVVDRLIRSLTPEPGAWTDSRWGRLRLGPVEPLAGPVAMVGTGADGSAGVRLSPGELRADKRELLVGTGSGAVRLGTVQAPGRRAIPAPDWARGARPASGERLGLAVRGSDRVTSGPS